MIYAGIMAAGTGARMQRQDLPKQFLPLGKKPIIINTLEQFFINPNIEKIIIVTPEHWALYTEDLIKKYDTMGKEVTVITGGDNKTTSVQMLVEYIKSLKSIGEDDILLTHDAVRPFITQRIIDDNIKIAKQYGSACTVMTTNDTIFVSEDSVMVSEIPLKRKMFAAQTPQTFNLKSLELVFKNALEQGIHLNEETELTRLYLRQGNKMLFVEGEHSNMKIINPYDLEVANALLKERKQW